MLETQLLDHRKYTFWVPFFHSIFRRVLFSFSFYEKCCMQLGLQCIHKYRTAILCLVITAQSCYRLLSALSPNLRSRSLLTCNLPWLRSATSLQTAAVALSSLATLSLSSSPPTQSQGLPSHNYVSSSFTSASNALSPPGIPIPRRSTSVHPSDISQSVPLDDGSGHSSPPNGVHVHDSNLTKGGKRKGTIFTCESCSKV